MQIIKEGNKELIGKIYFRCNNCKCEFIADKGEYGTYGCTSPNVAGIDCPCCGEPIRAYIDEGHQAALYIAEQDKIVRLNSDDIEDGC